jgi:drug/metabolite transporter (DMT)-like permease
MDIGLANADLQNPTRAPDFVRPAPSSFVVFLVAGSAIVLFALSPVTARVSVGLLDGMNLGLVRVVGTGLLALPVLVVCRLKPPEELRDWGLLAVSSFGTFAAFPLLFAVGSQSTSAAHVSLIMASMPLFTGLVAATFDAILPGRAWFIGAALAMAGEVLMVLTNNQSQKATGSVSGDLVVLAGCILCASGSAAAARLTARTGTWSATFWAATLAGIGLAPVAVLKALEGASWRAIDPLTWAAIVHFTIVAGLFAFVAWFWALARGGAVRIAPLQFAQPVLALLFASLLLSEQLTPQLILSGALILGGIVITYHNGNRRWSAPLKVILLDVWLKAGRRTEERRRRDAAYAYVAYGREGRDLLDVFRLQILPPLNDPQLVGQRSGH